jgi:hypothetical protein
MTNTTEETFQKEFKKYQDAVSRVLNILKEDGYCGGKTVKDYETIKAFPDIFLQSLERQAAAIINEIPDNFYACCGCSLKSMKERLTSKYVRN